MVLDALINKQDNFEIVRDQIAAILALETVNQQTLAEADMLDPSLWAFDVYIERSVPWARFQNTDEDQKPIVNVWFENSNYDRRSSSPTSSQLTDSQFHIDVYAAGVAHVTSEGHAPADEKAALNCQRIIRLVRNIVMAAQNHQLGLTGVVAHRWFSAVTSFQPQQENEQATHIVAGRMTLDVRHTEENPEVEPMPLETLTTLVTLDPSGAVLPVDYDFTQ